jgi:putative heme-binding domain-containing protein
MTRSTCVALLAACLVHATVSIAAETPKIASWSDPQIPTTEGLYLWLDASRVNASREAASKPVLKNGDPVEAWPDASGHQRDVAQKEEKRRPRLHQSSRFHGVRFDGVDDYLLSSGQKFASSAVTVFIVGTAFQNPGGYAAMVAMAPHDGNDFQQGLNVDLGPALPNRLDSISVEGAGVIGGAGNLCKDGREFGEVTRVCVASGEGSGGLILYLNGKPQGTRDRAGNKEVRLDEITIGSRYYTAFGGSPIKGVFNGEIAEVLIFDRLLSDAERTQIDSYLTDKYGKVGSVPVPESVVEGKKLVRVTDPPPVQVLVPGFSARQLPLQLSNINNVLYRADGKAYALAYDGKVYLLSDTDGDGLEDKADVFFDNGGKEPLRAPVGMDLTPPGYSHGNGVFVAAKSKCSLIVDTNGDDKSDREIVMASSARFESPEEKAELVKAGKWIETGHGVDALGVAFDKRDGSVYFGLGPQNFTNGYLLENGTANYKLDFERGTIIRISPDFKSKEVVCTGIRFPVGIRFNAAADLFCTDQEGASWKNSNGNPFDELLQIQTGRHYGFPPRHPTHLPGVIDEPSVFDYRPQHESTCGLNFNEPVNGGPVFGPAAWRSDVFVSGYSRGRLYRTALVKTEAGYVARTQLFAVLSKLLVDACVTPQGALLVATHSGIPDWGTGAVGQGTLYKIEYSTPDLPLPMLAWAPTEQEVRVAFDRPVDPASIANLQQRASLEYGRYVDAGDRFWTLTPPPYQVVQNQIHTPRFELPIHSVQVTPDRRTLILATGRHPEAVNYALTLPGLGRNKGPSRSELPQHSETDLQYDLTGASATWTSRDGKTTARSWLPHLQTSVAKRFTQHSAEHDAFWSAVQDKGSLKLETQLALDDMLRPAVQPGSELDYEWPAETVTVVFRSRTPLTVKISDQLGAKAPPVTTRTGKDNGVYSVFLTATEPERVPIELTVETDQRAPDLSVVWFTNEDSTERALAINRTLVPWAPLKKIEDKPVDVSTLPQLAGGDWAHGRELFFSEQGLCFKCHTLQGTGGNIGPPLLNLPHRDYESVLRDIAQPSAAINPVYLSQTIALQDGRVLTGTVRAEGDTLFIGDTNGKMTEIARSDVDTMVPSKLSVMPEKLLEKLGPENTRDLMLFLLSGPPHLVDYGRLKPPASRPLKEVQAVLAGSEHPPASLRKVKVVLVAGRKDHGPGEHDYPAWKVMWQRLMTMAPETVVETADEWPSPGQLETADCLVFYQQGTWTSQRAQDIDAYLARGGGLVYIHYAVDGGQDAPGFAQRIGLAWRGGASAFRHGELELGFEPGKDHPIARNIQSLKLHDESYWQLTGDPTVVRVIATGIENGKPQPLFWTLEPSNGRVFVSIPGHFSWSFDDPLFRLLLLRGIAWSTKESVDRFNELVLPGARVAE